MHTRRHSHTCMHTRGSHSHTHTHFRPTQTHTHTYPPRTHAHIHPPPCLPTHVHTHMYACAHAHAQSHSQAHAGTPRWIIPTQADQDPHAWVCHTDVHTCTCMHQHMCTHTDLSHASLAQGAVLLCILSAAGGTPRDPGFPKLRGPRVGSLRGWTPGPGMPSGAQATVAAGTLGWARGAWLTTTWTTKSSWRRVSKSSALARTILPLLGRSMRKCLASAWGAQSGHEGGTKLPPTLSPDPGAGAHRGTVDHVDEGIAIAILSLRREDHGVHGH